jgi:hypothetical protein
LTSFPIHPIFIINKSKERIKMTVLNLKDFPDDLHRKAKAQAALMGISMKEFIIRAMEEYLEKQKGGEH